MIIALFILAIPITLALQSATIIMKSEGNIIYTITANAKSGSPEDIQAAVNLVSSRGGGTVYIPSGTFTFNVNSSNIALNNYPAGVIIPGGVNIIGAGITQTILKQTTVPPDQSDMFYIHGENGKPVRISGIGFEGYVITADGGMTNAIYIDSVNNFRVDHCSFRDFSNAAIEAFNNRWETGCKGVIDHVKIDNPYKDTIGGIWGYGVIFVGTYYNWDNNINNILGKYDDINNIYYVENSDFSRCRHAIASNGGAFYVVRYNQFNEPRPTNFGIIDIHGQSGIPPAVGGRGLEAYENVINGVAGGVSQAFWIRGGSGVIYNNTINNCDYGVMIYKDSNYAPCYVSDLYIWNNQIGNVANPFSNNGGYVENIDYFLYRKSYNIYLYPHYLTLQSTP